MWDLKTTACCNAAQVPASPNPEWQPPRFELRPDAAQLTNGAHPSRLRVDVFAVPSATRQSSGACPQSQHQRQHQQPDGLVACRQDSASVQRPGRETSVPSESQLRTSDSFDSIELHQGHGSQAAGCSERVSGDGGSGTAGGSSGQQLRQPHAAESKQRAGPSNGRRVSKDTICTSSSHREAEAAGYDEPSANGGLALPASPVVHGSYAAASTAALPPAIVLPSPFARASGGRHSAAEGDSDVDGNSDYETASEEGSGAAGLGSPERMRSASPGRLK